MHDTGLALLCKPLVKIQSNNYGCRFFCTTHNSDTDTELRWVGGAGGWQRADSPQLWPLSGWPRLIPHGMMSKWHKALPTATWSYWELPFRTFGPRPF